MGRTSTSGKGSFLHKDGCSCGFCVGGKTHHKNDCLCPFCFKKELNDIRSATGLRKAVITRGILEERCALCSLGTIWNDKEIVLQLDHIDGNPRNNSVINLRFLCPNCHTQTDNWGSKKRTIEY